MKKEQLIAKDFITKFLPNITIVIVFMFVWILVYLSTPKNTDIDILIKVSEETQQQVQDLIQEVQLDKLWFTLENDTCNFEYTWNYNYVDLYGGEFKTPSQKPSLSEYTRKLNISWNIEEVKICILWDIRDDHKVPWYSFYIYTYLGSDYNQWYANVWRYAANKQLFDRDSWGRNKELYGRFDGDQTPFKQVLDLEQVIVADLVWGEMYKYIRPIVNFQKTWSISVGAYLEWDTHRYAWEILQFRIIWKWWGNISVE